MPELSLPPKPVPVRAHPPTEPSGAMKPREATWPLVLGVVSLIFGIGGLLMGLYGMASPWFTQYLESVAPVQMSGAMAAAGQYAALTVGIYAVSLVLAGALLAGGIGLLNQRRWSRRVLLAWAVSKVVYAVPATMLQMMMQKDAMLAAQASAAGAGGGAMPPMANNIMQAMGVFGMIIGLAWLSALPAVMMAWLWRPTIRAQVNGWK